MRFDVRFNVPTDGGGNPTFTPPAPEAPPAAPQLRNEAELRQISEVMAGVQAPPFPFQVAAENPPTTESAPAAPSAPVTTPTIPETSLTPMQAALQLLNSSNVESQKAGKELLDRLMAAPQGTPAAPAGPELPPAPDWNARQTALRTEVESFFKDLYKQPVIEEGRQVLNDNGEPEFRYPDMKRLVWQVDTEIDRRLEKERSSYNQKVTEVQSQFTEKQREQDLQVQWKTALDSTVKTTLLQTIFDSIPDARTKTPQGQDGVKTDVYKKYERLARGLAKEVADSINYDNPRYSGPNGLNAVMYDVAAGVRSELSLILPKGATTAVTAVPEAPFVQKATPPPSTGAPLAPSAYQPPVPGTGPKSWEKPMRPSARAAIGLAERMRETVGGLPTPTL